MAAAGLSLSRRRRPRWLDRLLVNTILLAGLVGVILAVQPLVLLALGRFPTSEERTVLVVSMIAAGVAALLYQPARKRLEQAASRLLPTEREAPGEVLRALGSGLSRAVPLDELIVELAESLRTALVLDATEVWTGSGGLLERVTSDPERGWASLTLAPAEESVVARAGVSGPAWLEVWLPALLEDRGGGPLRVAPMANARELLGLVVAERARWRTLRRARRARARRVRPAGRPRFAQRPARLAAPGVARRGEATDRGGHCLPRPRRLGGGRRAAPYRARSTRRRAAAAGRAVRESSPRA